jgi:hypothetical protein
MVKVRRLYPAERTVAGPTPDRAATVARPQGLSTDQWQVVENPVLPTGLEQGFSVAPEAWAALGPESRCAVFQVRDAVATRSIQDILAGAKLLEHPRVMNPFKRQAIDEVSIVALNAENLFREADDL